MGQVAVVVVLEADVVDEIATPAQYPEDCPLAGLARTDAEHCAHLLEGWTDKLTSRTVYEHKPIVVGVLREFAPAPRPEQNNRCVGIDIQRGHLPSELVLCPIGARARLDEVGQPTGAVLGEPLYRRRSAVMAHAAAPRGSMARPDIDAARVQIRARRGP